MGELTKWDVRFMEMAELVSTWSMDKKRKVGVVIVNENNMVLSIGYNSFASKINENLEYRHIKPIKNFYVEHGERNAIFNAAKHGVKLNNSTMYVSWFPCSECCRAIIQSGVKTVVCVRPDYSDDSWGETFKVSTDMFDESGIEIKYVS